MRLDRTLISILEALSDGGVRSSSDISRFLRQKGIAIDPRTVRYHLKKLESMGYVRRGRRGAELTASGEEFLKRANVFERLGEFTEVIEFNAYHCTFDPLRMTGTVPTDVAIVDKDEMDRIGEILLETSKAGFLISPLISTADEGEVIDGYEVGKGRMAIAVISNTIFDVILRRSGVNLLPEYAGLLYWRDRPVGIREVISYSGTTLSPGWLFLNSGLTAVWSAVRRGEGYLITAIRSLSRYAVDIAWRELERAKARGFGGVVYLEGVTGNTLNIPPGVRARLVVLAGLNYLAPLVENGVGAELKVNQIFLDYRDFSEPEKVL
ncbi:NrpR regulatory domain-containing protein [Geoglobus sp.]